MKMERVFPHMRYLQEQATKMGIKCHDLRKGFAKRTYKEELENDSPRSEALDKTRKKSYAILEVSITRFI